MVVWEALDALSHQLELCRIEAASRVALLFEDRPDADRVALVRAAVARTGAEALDVRPIRANDPTDSSLLLAVIDAADIVITTSRIYAESLLTDGRRILLLEADCSPEHYPPHASLRQRVQSLATKLAAASELTLTDEHGTTLVCRLTANTFQHDHGLFDDGTHFAAFPAGWVASIPAPAAVSGELVIMPGDANVTGQRTISSPVRFEIIDDHISTIYGDSADADLIRALFEYSGQSGAYGIASIAIGMNPAGGLARAFDSRLLNPQLSRLAAGVFTISFGENLVADRPCNQTVTLALPGRTVHIDGLPTVVNGSLQGDFAPDVYEL